MNKSNLLEAVSSKLREEGLTITKRNLKNIVNSILVYMSQSLSNNEEVKISNFGTFRKVKRKEKKGKDFKTGLICHIPERFTIVFRVSKNGLKTSLSLIQNQNQR